MSKLRKKNYTKNSNKIQKHKIKKSLKRGQIYFPSFNLGRKHRANTLTRYTYRGGDPDESQQIAKENAEEYLQQVREYINTQVNEDPVGFRINYQNTESLQSLVAAKETLTVAQKEYMTSTMREIIRRYKNEELAKNKRGLLEILTEAIKEKKELLIKYDNSCPTSLRPSSKFGFISRMVSSIDTRIKKLEDENTVLNGCVQLLDLTREERDQLESLSTTQNENKIKVLTSHIIIQELTEDLRIVEQIESVYQYPTVSQNVKPNQGSHLDYTEKLRLERNTGTNTEDIEHLYGYGGYKKRRTKRHMQNNKRRHTKKRN
jgi:hypothetical protein